MANNFSRYQRNSKCVAINKPCNFIMNTQRFNKPIGMFLLLNIEVVSSVMMSKGVIEPNCSV